MHILLTDVLTCPRCGPEMGLIMISDRVEDRRVLEGRLGCANCRETYPVSGGVADLRTPATPAGQEAPPPPGDADEAAVRTAALLGLSDARGTVLLAGPGAALAPAVAALLPDLEVVAFGAEPGAGEGAPGVSRVAGGPGLPFRARSLRGVALTADADADLLAEGVRALAQGARLLVEPAGPEAAGALRSLGAEVLLEQEGVVVARAPGERVPLRMNALR